MESYLIKFNSTADPAWLAKARQELQQAESRDPDEPIVHFEAAGVNRAAKWFDKAIDEDQRVIKLEPWNGDAWDHLGLVFAAMRHWVADGADAFEKAQRLQRSRNRISAVYTARWASTPVQNRLAGRRFG